MDKQIIEKVKNNEVIYNHKLGTYRDKAIKRATWERIGKELGISGSHAKARWDTLRRCYSNARNRRREGECKQAWKYEKQMSFLLPFIQDRMTKGFASASKFADMSYKSEDFTVEGYCEDTADETSNFKTERDECSFSVERDDVLVQKEVAPSEGTNNFTASDSDEQNEFNFEAHFTPNKQPAEHIQQTRSTQKQDFAQKEENSSLHLSNDNGIFATFDHTDFFFLSMSKMTKQLPKADQAKIKLELSNSVLSAEIKYFERQTE